MGKTANLTIEELSALAFEYADIIGAIQTTAKEHLYMPQRYYLLYICHLFDIDQNAYGLVNPKKP